MTLLRDGKTHQVSVKLVPAPEKPPRETLKVAGRSPFTGATVMNISPAVAEEFHRERAHGRRRHRCAGRLIAANVGIQKGEDIVLAINDRKIERTADVRTATARPSAYWKLSINRGGHVFTTVIGG